MKSLAIGIMNLLVLVGTIAIGALLLGLMWVLSHKNDDVMARYERTKGILQREVHDKGPIFALEHFRTIVEDDKELSRLCHGLAHEIGHSAYNAYGLKALDETDDICGSGYLHGIIEHHFADVRDIKQVVRTLCTEHDGRCFHGLGHGLMYALENDVPASLAYCKTLPKASQQNQCAEGVFMENFSIDEDVHASAFLKKDDPFFPCRNQSPAFMAVCAFYAPRYFLSLHDGDYDGALQACREIDRDALPACIKGVGSAAMKFHIDDPSFAFDLCSKREGSVMRTCTEGATSYLVVHYASPETALQYCTALPQAQKSICQSIAGENRTFYPAK